MQYWSASKTFGAELSPSVIEEMLRYARASGRIETGGILVGRYNHKHSCALIEKATGPPTDSRQARTWFHRGIKGLQKLLHAHWSHKRRYYLGEWHFHPGGRAEPSSADRMQMRSIARNSRYACPEPILVILAGDPDNSWEIGVFVFPRNAPGELVSELNAPD